MHDSSQFYSRRIGVRGSGEDPALGLLPGRLAPLLPVLDPDVGRPHISFPAAANAISPFLRHFAALVASGGWFLAPGVAEERRSGGRRRRRRWEQGGILWRLGERGRYGWSWRRDVFLATETWS